MPRRRKSTAKSVETLTHEEASRPNLPSAEHQALLDDDQRAPLRAAFERRNKDLDPQLVWRGKDQQDAAQLAVDAPPLYIQERVHPKAVIDDLLRQTERRRDDAAEGSQPGFADLFADFNGLPSEGAKTEFYQHDANWSNRMILGDSLQVMASLAEREGLRGAVQCIYLDPPYGIRFNSNFQWSTTDRDVKDGNRNHITREPEQVKAFRDTWRDGIHSYLGYLRDRLLIARELLAESGSIFVQIGDEHVHRVRALMDEVFGEENFVSQIVFAKTTGFSSTNLSNVTDHLLWYARHIDHLKYRPLVYEKVAGDAGARDYRPLRDVDSKNFQFPQSRLAKPADLVSQGATAEIQTFTYRGREFDPPPGSHWKTTLLGMSRLDKASRIFLTGNTLRYLRFLDDFPSVPFTNLWSDTISSFQEKSYVVQTTRITVQRCVLMTTDPGDLVLDPTCGSGTTAHVAEEWGRRWITIDTSRVALALARARIMGARYPYYLLTDSNDGQAKQAEIEGRAPVTVETYGDVRQGFVYERVPHVMLKDIAHASEIDVIWEEHEQRIGPLRERLSTALGERAALEEWEIPREAPDDWSGEAAELHGEFWRERLARQQAIDASIARNAEFEYLYDKPYEDAGKVRVAGPFTVESVSPHRMLEVDEHGETFDRLVEEEAGAYDFARVILDNLKTAGVQQARREDRIEFSSLVEWPGDLVCAEGRYSEGETEQQAERRAAIFIGPEFGTVSRPDLVEAAKEAAEAGFDALIACAFNYDAHTTELEKLGRIPVLKARMNADLHMAGALKNTGAGNLFVIFGEPDIDIEKAPDDQIKVRVKGVDVFHPASGEVRSDNADGIACWFVDTDYNEEAFFVRQAYFLGANDPYKSLKTTLKAEIDAEAWATLHSDTSRPFNPPASGRIAVKVINHLGDEVMKVFRV